MKDQSVKRFVKRCECKNRIEISFGGIQRVQSGEVTVICESCKKVIDVLL